MWENATDEVIDAAILVLSEELREIVREKRRKRRRKCRNWIVRRESPGASNCLLRELSSQDPQEYRRHMRMSVGKFDEVLRLVESYISKTDTVMKAAIPARLKLEVTLASGDSFSSLALLFRISPCTAVATCYWSLDTSWADACNCRSLHYLQQRFLQQRLCAVSDKQ